MRRILQTLSLVVLLTNQSFAQKMHEGAVVLTGGYGMGNFGQTIFRFIVRESGNITNEDFRYRLTGPGFIKAEVGLSEHFSWGLNLAALSMNASWSNQFDYKVNFNSLSALFRVNAYLVNDENFVAYAGCGLGYRFSRFAVITNDPFFRIVHQINLLPYGMDLTAGFRLYLSEKVALYGEFGMAKGIVQTGISFQL